VDDFSNKCQDDNPSVYGYVRPHNGERMTPYIGSDAQGSWKLKVSDNQGGDEGFLHGWTIELTDDIDADNVTNDIDNCPYHYNPYHYYKGDPYQRDENGDHVGNECECEYHDFNTYSDMERQCHLLYNWGVDERYWKGIAKNPGDWVEVIVPLQTIETFQPGDYTHQDSWLGCDCLTYPILP